MTLKDKVIVITGASQGLGKSLSQRLAAEKARVILVARSTEKIKKIASDLQKQGLYARFFTCDIRDLSQVKKTVQEILKDEKHIDILINNAGVWTDNDIEKIHPEKRQEAFDINALGTIQFTQEILPHLKKRGGGYIFTVISTSGISDTLAGDNKFWQTYGATKWAVSGFVQALRSELIDTHIKVTGFYPGGIDTNLYENAGRTDAHKQPWMMKIEDIVDIVLFALTRPDDVLMEKVVVTKVFKHT